MKIKGLFLFLFGLFVFIWVIDTLNSTRMPKPGEPAELYANQLRDDLKQHFLAAIQGAEKSVLLATYTMNDSRIINSLKRKSKEGVEVTVLCDKKVCPHNIQERLGPNIKMLGNRKKGIDHRKILIIDEKQVWLGSANMTGDSLRIHGNLVAAVESPSLALELKERIIRGRRVKQDFMMGGQSVELWCLPEDPGAINRVKELIKMARKTAKVAMFTWTRTDLADELIEAKKRGVDVEVVIDANAGRGVGKKVVNQLQREGVNVSLSNGPGILHHKFIYIDGKTLVNGSANWTKAAFTVNTDCFLVFHDLNLSQRQKLDRLWRIIRLESIPVNKKMR